MTSGVTKYILAQYAPFPYYWRQYAKTVGFDELRSYFVDYKRASYNLSADPVAEGMVNVNVHCA